MKLARLLFLLVLLGSVLIVPEVFGAKSTEGILHQVRAKDGAATAEICYLIICASGLHTVCCGSQEYCLGYCDAICGTGPGSCHAG